MIERLTLTGFGKFRNAVFDLSGVTVVYGPNEAGKTTFFDGLFQALCRPSETKKSGKVLKARYGAARAAQATVSNDVPITDEEFMNLYAIREGDLRLELDKGSEWLDKLKSRLFHGGLDPAEFLAEFDKRSSDSRTMVHSKELEKAKEVSAKTREELETRKRARSELSAKENSLAQAEASLQVTRGLLEAGTVEMAALDVDSAREDRIALRQKWTAQLDRLEEWDAMEAAAAALAPFREDRREEWNALSAATRLVHAKLLAEKGKREHQESLLAQARTENRAAREAKEASGPRSALAARLAGEARQALEGKSPGGIPLSAIASVIVFGLGGIASVRLPAGPMRIAGVGVCLLLAVFAFFLSIRLRQSALGRMLVDKLSVLKDRWAVGATSFSGVSSASAIGTSSASASETSSPAIPSLAEISTLEGFIQAMEASAREKDALEAKEADTLRRREDQKDALERIDANLRSFKDQEESALRAEREWLARHGVVDSEEYLLKVDRCRQVQTDAAKRRAELEALAQGSDWSALRKDLRRKLQDLDEAGVAEKGLDDAAMQRLRQRRKELQGKQEELGRREGGLIAQKERLAGEISGAMGKLAPEIVAWEDRLAQAVADVKRKELDKQAAALARDIFRDIGDGADLMLQSLAGDMEAILANILPGSLNPVKGRMVSLAGLEDRLIQVEDAAGGVRSLDHLSTGTRHAMVLAAKLALARKHRNGPGLLVLDEPFLAMDDERESRALELLRDFHDHNGWQIILLTKEIRLVEKVRKLFPEPRIIDLARLSG